jgi:hemolysin III
MRDKSSKEELLNSITHGIGIPLAVAGLVLMIIDSFNHQSNLYLIAALVYGLTMLWTYLTSTVYHSLHRAKPKVRQFVHLLDHTAIYLFIAGTYTPVALFVLPEPWSTVILSAVWILALTGLIYKIFFLEKHKKLSLAIYLLMGWLIVFAIKPLLDHASPDFLIWLLAGGISYTIGTIFFSLRKLPYAHSIWHLFVLGGSICHFLGIYFHLY